MTVEIVEIQELGAYLVERGSLVFQYEKRNVLMCLSSRPENQSLVLSKTEPEVGQCEGRCHRPTFWVLPSALPSESSSSKL